MAIVKISELPEAVTVNDQDVMPISISGITKGASRSDFLADQDIVTYVEDTHDYGSVASGTVTPDCANAANHLITATGAITLAAPIATILTDRMVMGFITIKGGDLNAITFDANYDWGDAGEFSLIETSVFAYQRGLGDVKTKIWSVNGGSVVAGESAVNGGAGVYSNRTAGYWGGGYDDTANVSTIDGINFTTEAAINPAAVLSVARHSLAGASSSNKGYFAGGVLSTYSAVMGGIQFSDESAVNPAATLSVARQRHAAVSSPDKGYWGGGTDGASSSTIDGINFTTEAAINPTAALSVARNGLAGVSSPDKGYFGGGNDGTGSSTIDGINFTTEAAINPAAALSVARYNLAGVSSPDKGYFGGGFGGAHKSTIDGIQFSDETAINPAAVLSVARNALAGVSSPDKGYFAGGHDGTISSTIDGINFTTEVAINPASTLSVARRLLAGV